MKILYFDTETTGIDPKLHDIIQFSAIVEVDGEVIDELDVRCQPSRWENISQDALTVTGMTIEKLKELPTPQEAFKQIKNFFDKHIDKYDKLDKFYPAGHNVSFDIDFLQEFFKRHGDEYGTGSYQNWNCLDSRILANFMKMRGKMELPNHKLETLCNHFEIPLVAHDSLNDIKATRILIQKLLDL